MKIIAVWCGNVEGSKILYVAGNPREDRRRGMGS
jgi:hypothetical protein